APVSPFNLNVYCVSDPPHGWGSGRKQLAGGANSGFISEYYPRVGNDLEAARVMGYHDRAQLPFYYGLADEFTLCDQWYCSVMGPTWPNRYYTIAAQSGGRMSNDFLPTSVTTIFDRLTAEGIPWRYYYADVPFLAVFVDKLGEYGPNIKPVDQYYADAAAGTLPNVTFVDPSYILADDHPPHHVQLGQGYVSSVFHALANGPHWSESLFVLTYDEWGGFYDHVAPPASAPDERAAEGFNQYGFRVPTVVAGPYVKRGHVSNVLHDHTSVAAYLEWLWNLAPLTERDAAAATLVDALDEARVLALDPRPVPALPDVIFDESTFSAFCIAEFLTALPLAFEQGKLPKEFDRRARIWETMG
ncbi:MAG: phosphoesterase, partial [Candidatus Methylomirabilis sp.]|nr:phosphoesterase [Deltaproteobacteria bacterium]